MKEHARVFREAIIGVGGGVIKLMDKHAMIKLKLKGVSNRKAAKLLGVNRKTVAKYWNEYLEQKEELEKSNCLVKEIQEKLCKKPVYNSKTRKARKYSKEMDQLLDEILKNDI